MVSIQDEHVRQDYWAIVDIMQKAAKAKPQKPTTLITLYKEICASSSLPLIVGGCDGNRYVVKPRGSGEGVLANVIEWLSIKLGRLMLIPVLEPALLTIETGFVARDIDPEIRELLDKSFGINFGTKYIENASAYNKQSAFEIDDGLKNNIFLFDLFLLNIDRHAGNPNMIFNDNQLFCLDYSSSITMRSAIDGKSYQEEAALKQIKRHPFYSDGIDADDFIKRFDIIEDKTVCGFADELPEEWMLQLNGREQPDEMRRMISDRLIDKINNAKSLRNRLEALRELKTETDEERRLRILKNKKAFEEKAGKNSTTENTESTESNFSP